MVLEAWDQKKVCQGAALLLGEKERLGIRESWSIAELKLTDKDFQKLVCWGRSQCGEAIDRLIMRTDAFCLPAPSAHLLLQGDAIAGLVLLALCAECTARNGSTDNVWRASVESLGDCSLRRTLFARNGSALKRLRDALEAAARKLGMRSGDLDDQSVNRWYRLLLLQGGVPRGDVGRLASRLDAPDYSSPFFVDALRQHVPSFREAWNALGQLRRGEVTRDRAATALRESPFFREPHKDILDAAEAEPSAALGPLDLETAPCDSVLNASVRLHWPEGQVEPAAALSPAFAAGEMLGSRVTLSVDGVKRATYYRREGRLRRFGGAGELLLPLALSWTVSAEGETETEFTEVELVEDGQDIACFDADGSRCGAGAQAVRYVVAREPIGTHPATRVVWLEQGLGVAKVEPGTVVATTNAAVQLWPIVEDRALGEEVHEIRIHDWKSGPEVGALLVTLWHPADVRVVSARVGAATFRVEPGVDGFTTLTGIVSAESVTLQTRMEVRTLVEQRPMTKTLPFAGFTGASIDGSWLTKDSVVEAARLRGGALRVSMGREFSGCDARLVAGGVAARLDKQKCRPQPLTRVLGYGESLVLCGQEPSPDGPRQVLASRIEDHGHVVGHEVNDGTLRLTHRLDLEDTVGYWLLVWPRRAAPVAYSLEGTVPSETGVFEITCERTDGAPRAVALCFANAIVGTSWANDWSGDLERAAVEPPTLVNLIRLLSLPVLAAAHLRAVVARLRGALVKSTDALLARKAHLAIGDAKADRKLSRMADSARWAPVARAMLVRLRLRGETHLRELEGITYQRHPGIVAPPLGAPATPKMLEDVKAQRANRAGPFRAYCRQLLEAGAIHPRDAVHLTAHSKNARNRLARSLADASVGINEDGLTVRNAPALRARALVAARVRLGVTDDSARWVLGLTREWMDTADDPNEEVHEALVDTSMHARLQIDLLDEIVPPNNNK